MFIGTEDGRVTIVVRDKLKSSNAEYDGLPRRKYHDGISDMLRDKIVASYSDQHSNICLVLVQVNDFSIGWTICVCGHVIVESINLKHH